MRRFMLVVTLAALGVSSVAAPAAAVISTPAANATVRGIITITEANGGDCLSGSLGPNTWIRIYNSSGNQMLSAAKGSCGAYSISWTTETVPNGSYELKSSARFCSNRVFGTCVSSVERTISDFWVTVQNLSTITNTGPASGVWDDVVTVAANLKDATTGWAVANRSVYFQIGDQGAWGTTDGSGNASASIRIGGSGSTTSSATFGGDAWYVASAVSGAFSVTPVPSALSLNGPFSGTWGTEVTEVVSLGKAASRSGVLAGRAVTISLGSKSASAVTDANGRARVTFLLDMPAGAYTLSGAFGGDGQVVTSSASGSFGSTRRATTLQYSGGTQVPWSDEVELAADLRDPANGEGVWGEVVRFVVGNVNTPAVTDSDGHARVNAPITADPGIYPLNATYAGNTSSYEASQASGVIEVIKRTTSLAVSGPATVVWQKQSAFTVTLTDGVTGGPLAGKAISVSFGTQGATVTTNSSGVGVATFTASDVPSSYAAIATYAGDAHYVNASRSLAVQVLRRPTRVMIEQQHVADAPDELTAASWFTTGAQVLDAETLTPLAGQSIAVVAGALTDALTTSAGGRAETTLAASLPRGLYGLAVTAPGDAWYAANTSRSVLAVGWDAFMQPGNGGAVFIDVSGKRARAIAPLNDPTQDTGVVQVSVVESQGSNGDRVVHMQSDAISGTFDRDDHTFATIVNGPSGRFALDRTTNVRPSAGGGSDRSVSEGDVVTFTGTAADADGPVPYSWWDFGDGTSAAGAHVAHIYEVRTSGNDQVYTATLTVTDDAGARARDAVVIWVKDTDTPLAPVITRPAPGALLSTQTALIGGAAEPGTTITVSEDEPIGQTIADSSGAWQMTATLANGSHAIIATASRTSFTSRPSATVTFRIDTIALAPVIAQPAEGAAFVSPSVSVGGSAEAGSSVAVTDGSVTIGVALADRLGNWSLGRTFADGSHTLTATATDAAGNISAVTTRHFSVARDTTPPDAPAITSPDLGSLNASTVGIRGTGEPNANIAVIENGVTIGTTISDSAGTWLLGASLSSGSHTVSARLSDAAGNVGPASAPVTFTVDANGPSITITTPSGNTYTPADSVTIQGAADDNRSVAYVEVNTFDALGNRRTERAMCTGCGTTHATWTTSPTLSPGRYRVDAYAVDGVGNRSSADHITFTRL